MPDTAEALWDAAAALEGATLAEIAEAHGVPVPADLRRAKGWVGELLEVALGATAGNDAEPDFPHLGIELKSIPVDARGPRESTWVCTAPFDGIEATWEASRVRKKLACVLWVPVTAEGPVSERVIGAPILWRPDPAEEATLRRDWEGVADAIRDRTLWLLRSKNGEALQVRPKAARARDTVWILDDEANWVRATPLGFYLRRSFTSAVLAKASPGTPAPSPRLEGR